MIGSGAEAKPSAPDPIMRMGRNRNADLGRSFIEDVGGGVVAKFEIDFFLSWIFQTIQIRIQDTATKSIGAWLAIVCSHCH
jgi:hypothetical protein